jgi:hypothetical protein
MKDVPHMLTAQSAMKFVPRMLSIFSMILKWVEISPYAEHAQN